jgi:disulfide bond formation protein DsbB
MKTWQFFMLSSFIYGAQHMPQWLSVTFQIIFLVLAVYAIAKDPNR